MSSTKENWPSVALVRTAGKCSLTWHSGLVGNCYLQLWLNLLAAMTFIKWIRDSWFHLNTFNKNSKVHGGHGHHVSPPPGFFLLLLFLFLLSLFLPLLLLLLLLHHHRERHTPCRSGPLQLNHFLFLWEGKKREEIGLKL